MKKFFAFTAAFAAIFAVSCNKEQDFDAPKSGEGRTISFVASHESDAAPEEEVKTDIDLTTGAVSWKAGDVTDLLTDIGSVFNSEAVAADGDKATFTYQSVDGAPLFAVYPTGLNPWLDTDKVCVTIPDVQDGSFASAAIEVANASGVSSLAFKNIGGMLQVTVGNDAVRKVVISSNDSNPLVGTVPVSFNGSTLELGDPLADATKKNSITLNVSGSGTYYAAVLPGTNLAAGFYVQLLDGSDDLVGEILTGATLTVARRQMRKLNLSTAGLISNKVFVTVDGTGDGSSWDNALDAAGFYSLLAGTSAKDKTIFMAAGTYPTSATDGTTVNAATTDLKVYGGYPTGLSGTVLTGRDIATNKTILSGGGDKRILVFNKNTLTAVFDGLEFANAYRSSAKTDMGTAVVINNCGNIKLVNCVIRDNISETPTTESSASTVAAGGGAVRAAAGTILFKGCTFSNNTATVGGGAMRVAGTANVTLEECVFSNNSSTSQNGGAIHMSKGTLTIKDSEFNNNSSATYGGAISVTQQASCTVNISGTRFFHNRAASTTYCGGALFVGKWTNTSDVTLDHCYFEENLGHTDDITTDLKNSILQDNQSTGGAIFVERNATLKLNHCNFYHNLCSQNGGAIRTKEETAILYMNACSFYMNYAGKYASTVQGSTGPIAMFNCVFYNNQNKSGSSPGTIRSTGELLIANTSIKLGSSYPGLAFGATTNSVLVNSIVVNSGSGTEAKKSILVVKNKTVSSFGHNLHSGLNADGSTYGTIDDTNAMAGSDQAIGLDDFPTWVGVVSGVEYHLLKIIALPATYYTDPGVDYRATPATVETAIDHFDTQNGTAFKAWLNTLDEGSGRTPLQVDFRGRLRSTEKIYPGSYDFATTE